MSATVTYKLPWADLDLRQIEAAAAAVAAGMGGVHWQTEVHNPTFILCFFSVPRPLAEPHNNSPAPTQDAPRELLPVQVDFFQLPDDGPGPYCLMMLDTGSSANAECWITACEIMEQLCRHLGGKLEPC
jgi:hypothetical protein